MAQRLLHRLEEPLQAALLLSTQPLIDPSALPLSPALQSACATLLTPTALALLGLLGLAVATAAAAVAALSKRQADAEDASSRRQQRLEQQLGAQPASAAAAAVGLGRAAAAAAAAAALPLPAPPPPVPQQQQQRLRAPAILALVASAAVLLRVAWAPLYSSLQLLPVAQQAPGTAVAAVTSTFASLSAALTWGSTAIAIGSVARLLLTAAPRAAAAEAAGAVVIAAALHRALVLADALFSLAVDLPLAHKVRGAVTFLLYYLATEVRGDSVALGGVLVGGAMRV